MFTKQLYSTNFVNILIMSVFKPIRLREARLLCGYSLDQLVKVAKLRITRQSIYRYEKGDMCPSSDVLSALASTMGVSEQYFYGDSIHVDMPMLRSSRGYQYTPEEEQRLEAQLCFWAERYIRMENVVGCSKEFVNPLSGASVSNLDDTICASAKLRTAWHCGDGPIASVLRLFERKGIKVLNMNLPDGIDGLSTWADNAHPLMVLDMNLEKTTVERLRFTACHELAHLLLSFSCDSELTIEKRCDKFASFFLFPKETFIEEMGGKVREDLTLEELIDLREVYGVSIAAQVHEAWDLQLITRQQYDWWYDERINKNKKEKGWGAYLFPETIGRERRIEKRLNNTD